MPSFVPRYKTLPFAAITPCLSQNALARVERLVQNPKSLYIALFPYYAGQAPGNISLYARGADYHTVVRRFLLSKIRRLCRQFPQNTFAPLVDASPLPEVKAAALAGLGCIGRHGLLISEEYGSYAFIGSIVSDMETAAQAARRQAKPCLGCGRCTAQCPTGALSDKGPCLSHITQKKGRLSAEEEAYIRQNGSIWGCDQCQKACPRNKDVPITPIADFREHLLTHLTSAQLDAMDASSFAQRAFSFRGRAPLTRNLTLTEAHGAAAYPPLSTPLNSPPRPQ